MLDFINAESSEYRTVQLSYAGTWWARILDVGRAVEPGRGPRGNSMKMEWSLEKGSARLGENPMVVLLAVLMAGAGCSKATPAAASKAPVTALDPDLFSVERQSGIV